MRRSDREISDKKEIERLIAQEQILRIAFYDDGDIYIVPVNYGYLYEDEQLSFYFHGACAGRKYGLSKANPVVGFEIDGNYKLLEGETACEYSAAFQSVTGTGVLQLLDGGEEKKIGLNALMRQLTGKDDWEYTEKMLEGAAVFKLEVQKISCKKK